MSANAIPTTTHPPGLRDALGRAHLALMLIDASGALVDVVGGPNAELRRVLEEACHAGPSTVRDPSLAWFTEPLARALAGEPAACTGFVGGEAVNVLLDPLRDAAGASGGVLGLALPQTSLLGLLAEPVQERELILAQLERVPLVLWATDRELRFTYLAGKEASASPNVLGTNLATLFGTDDPAHPSIAAHERALAGEPSTFEVEFKEDHFQGHVEPLRDATGAIIGCVGIAMNVTSRRRTEAELRREKAFVDLLQRVAIAANEATEIARPTQTCLDAVCELIGWPVGHAYRRDDASGGAVPTDLWHLPGDGALSAFRSATAHHPVAKGQGLVGRILATRQPEWMFDLHLPERFQRADAARAAGLQMALGFPVLVDGEVELVLEFFSRERAPPDERLLEVLAQLGPQLSRVLERQHGKERLARSLSLLEATLESTADGILVVNREGRVTLANGKFAEMWRLPPELVREGNDEHLLAAATAQLQDPDAFAARVRQLYSHPDASTYDVLRFKDGRVFERYSQPQRIGSDIVGRVWSFRDVTERRRMEAERDRLMREAQEAVRVRDDFLSIASHELKTPLASVSLRLQMLTRRLRGLDDAGCTDAEQAKRSLDRITALINDLLDVSRIQAGRLSMRLELVPLVPVVRDVVESSKMLSDEHRLSFEGPSRELVVQGDPGRLEQVVANLVENAIKYSPDGGDVRVRLFEEDGRAILTVADEGIGIPPDQQAHLFDRYFRARNVSSQGIAGLGLGLYICRDVVDRLGGDIRVESEPGRGSTFIVRLPLAEAPSVNRHSPMALDTPDPRA